MASCSNSSCSLLNFFSCINYGILNYSIFIVDMVFLCNFISWHLWLIAVMVFFYYYLLWYLWFLAIVTVVFFYLLINDICV